MLFPHMFKLQYVIIIGFSTWFRAKGFMAAMPLAQVDFAPDTDDATRSSFLRSCLDLFGGGADMDRKAIQIVWFWGCTHTQTHTDICIHIYIYIISTIYMYLWPSVWWSPRSPRAGDGPYMICKLYIYTCVCVYVCSMCMCKCMQHVYVCLYEYAYMSMYPYPLWMWWGGGWGCVGLGGNPPYHMRWGEGREHETRDHMYVYIYLFNLFIYLFIQRCVHKTNLHWCVKNYD